MTQWFAQWYLMLSEASRVVSEPIQQFMAGQNLPGLSALLLGVLGGLAPCQVTANAGAIAYVTQARQDRLPLWRSVWAYLAGKAVIYLALGFLAVMLGLRVPNAVLGMMRKLTGPLMVGVGLYLTGWIRLQGGGGTRLTEWLVERTPRWAPPPLWLGAAFSLGFCPTMAVIFFGALMPLVAQAQAGLLLTLIFAVGTALPVILWAAALSVSREAARKWVRGVRRGDVYVRWVAAAVLILVGLNDTLLYWLT